MALLQDTNVYQPCRDLTSQIHRQVQVSLHRLKGKHGKDHQWVELHYNQLLPTGRSSPLTRFYGLPKIHKAKLPNASPSFSLWDLYIKFSQISNQNLKSVHWTHFLLRDKLQSIELQDNEELVSFDVSTLFTSIPVNQALDVSNELIIQHQTDMEFKSKFSVAWYKWSII